jgi:hypothetical protein
MNFKMIGMGYLDTQRQVLLDATFKAHIEQVSYAMDTDNIEEASNRLEAAFNDLSEGFGSDGVGAYNCMLQHMLTEYGYQF